MRGLRSLVYARKHEIERYHFTRNEAMPNYGERAAFVDAVNGEVRRAPIAAICQWCQGPSPVAVKIPSATSRHIAGEALRCRCCGAGSLTNGEDSISKAIRAWNRINYRKAYPRSWNRQSCRKALANWWKEWRPAVILVIYAAIALLIVGCSIVAAVVKFLAHLKYLTH